MKHASCAVPLAQTVSNDSSGDTAAHQYWLYAMLDESDADRSPPDGQYLHPLRTLKLAGPENVHWREPVSSSTAVIWLPQSLNVDIAC
jgi:hypothetical protein